MSGNAAAIGGYHNGDGEGAAARIEQMDDFARLIALGR